MSFLHQRAQHANLNFVRGFTTKLYRPSGSRRVRAETLDRRRFLIALTLCMHELCLQEVMQSTNSAHT